MAKYQIRIANSGDFPAIKQLINKVQINPTGLDWHHFILAIDETGRMVGCGQLKPHGGGVIELASIAVEPLDRKNGVARAVIEYLINKAPRPLYLTCLSSMGAFYEKCGFREVKIDEMPHHFHRLVRWVKKEPSCGSISDELLVIKLM